METSRRYSEILCSSLLVKPATLDPFEKISKGSSVAGFTRPTFTGFWMDKENRRWLLDSIAPKIGVQHLDDWYAILPSSVPSQALNQMINYHYSGNLMLG